MNPFLLALVQAGIVTQADADRINRSLDPDAARAWAEQQLAIATQSGLSAQQARLVEMVRRTNGNLSAAMLDDFWAREDDLLLAAMRPTLADIATERAIGAAVRMGAEGDMWRNINQAVIGWTDTYYTSAEPSFVGSIPNLNQTSRAQVADAFTRWNRGELNDGRQGGLPALITELEQSFDPVRAERIAVTETTRIFSEAELAAASVEPELQIAQWDTAFDELVCEICKPLNNMQVEKGAEFAPGLLAPPAHVNCRCGITFLTRAGAGMAAAEKAPEAQPAPEWKPAMSRADAERFVAQSKFKDDTYHITQGVANERSIKANGFDLSRRKFGRIWGDGVYVGMDDETAVMYTRWTGPGARQLTIKTDVRNPFVYSAKSEAFTQWDIIMDALGVTEKRAIAIYNKAGENLSKVLSDAGYDALHINSMPAGGNQMVVFDPKKVVVVND